MFEKDLSDKLKRIFDFKKTTYSSPGESQEQNVLFIDVDVANCAIKDGRAVGRVTGQCIVFAQNDKLPLTYMAERINGADSADTKDLTFFNISTNTKGLQNLVMRSFEFVYLFNRQHDPDLGSITSTTFQQVQE